MDKNKKMLEEIKKEVELEISTWVDYPTPFVELRVIDHRNLGDYGLIALYDVENKKIIPASGKWQKGELRALWSAVTKTRLKMFLAYNEWDDEDVIGYCPRAKRWWKDENSWFARLDSGQLYDIDNLEWYSTKGTREYFKYL